MGGWFAGCLVLQLRGNALNLEEALQGKNIRLTFCAIVHQNKESLRLYWLRSLPSNIWKDVFVYIFAYYAIYLGIQ